MAITKVPKVGGTNFGGQVYGLSMSIGYSQAPSTLTVSVVNEAGIYSPPGVGSVASVQFGSFNFIGYVWTTKITKNSSENVLEVTLIDGSVVLDQYYVLLWKRGLFGLNGTPVNLNRTYSFNEDIIVPVKRVSKNGYPRIIFENRFLGSQTVSMTSRRLLGAEKIGNAIIVGREKFSNSDCDIPDTYYYFNDLVGAIPGGIGGNSPNDAEWKGTHEGSLRSVLASWASDLGYDFYWDFSNLYGGLTFFDVSNEISSVPSVSASNVISEEQTVTLEGTFKQYGVSYTAMPRAPLKSLSGSTSYTILNQVNPYSLSYLSRRFGEKLNLDNQRDSWGSKRSQNEFLVSCFLGYVSRELRDIYSFEKEYWDILGYSNVVNFTSQKEKLLDFLKDSDYAPMISDLESFDAKDLPNYDFIFASLEQTYADTWYNFEQLMLQNLGKNYRIPDSSGSFIRCSAKGVSEIDISVDPEGSTLEEDNDDFNGSKIFQRDGQMSHDQSSALEQLRYEEIKQDLDKCKPIQINLKEAGLLDEMVESNILSKEIAEKVTSLILFPNKKFRKEKIGYEEPNLSSGTHPLELSIIDLEKANIDKGRKNCVSYEKALQANSCLSAEEIAKNRALRAAGGDNNNNNDNPDKSVSGLVNNRAQKCRIRLKSGSIDLHGPCDGLYQVVSTYSITTSRFSEVQNPQFIFSSGRPGGASDVAEIRVVNENITDPSEDSFQSDRGAPNFIRAKDSFCTAPQRTATFVFAGDPVGVTLSAQNGLSKLDVSLSSDGYKTTVAFSTRPPKLSRANDTIRNVNSQFNRTSYNSA